MNPDTSAKSAVIRRRSSGSVPPASTSLSATGPATKLYVTFLSDAPVTKPRLPLTSDKEALEAFAMKDLDVFIVSGRKTNGFYGFPNNFIEKELGVSGTTRNWSTVTRIVALGRSEVA